MVPRNPLGHLSIKTMDVTFFFFFFSFRFFFFFFSFLSFLFFKYKFPYLKPFFATAIRSYLTSRLCRLNRAFSLKFILLPWSKFIMKLARGFEILTLSKQFTSALTSSIRNLAIWRCLFATAKWRAVLPFF